MTPGAPGRLATAGCALAAALLCGLAPRPAAAQSVYLAFGDSITYGFADEEGPRGYPPVLEQLLVDRGRDAVVENHGVPGETTAEGLSRINSVLAGGDVLLLMEGTNDIGLGISPETITFNLDAMADRAHAAGVETVHATVVPRMPGAGRDGTNRFTRDLAGLVRELAWKEGRNLADPFEVFYRLVDDPYGTLYNGGDDKLHPNSAGYDLIARIFADVLTGRDEVPPVIGRLAPYNDQQNTPEGAEIRVDLYDFGAGIDPAFTRLSIDDQPVEATITGDEHRQLIRYKSPEPWSGVVYVGIEARDRANPPNTEGGRLLQFVVEGAEFLPGDIDRDGRVDGADLISLARAFGSHKGMASYLGVADLDHDNDVDGEDLAIFASNFGKSSF